MIETVHAMLTIVNHSVDPRRVYIGENAAMHDTYRRLMQAAQQLKRWNSATEISTGLTGLGYEVSLQTLTNWKTRGVSKDALLRLPRYIGCSAEWLATGAGPICSGTRIAEPGRDYPSIGPDERELLKHFGHLTPKQRADIVQKMREQASENLDIVEHLAPKPDP